MWSLINGLSIVSKLKAVAIAGAILTATHGGAYFAGYLVGGANARADQKEHSTKEAFDRIQDLEKSNGAFKSLSDRHRCLVFMRYSGLPDDECD